MKITRLQIKNYRAIATLDATISPKGAIATGGNGRGKTTVLRAIRAALVARDIGPDAIREGEDRAEILVDLDEVTVRRIITRTGGSLSVNTSAHDRKIKPQNYLTELLGTSPLDPLDLFLAKPRDRRAMVLAALPVKVTAAEFDAWVPEWARDLVPEHVRGMLENLHGIDACAALHKVFYDLRAEANADAKAAKAQADANAKRLDEVSSGVPSVVCDRPSAARTVETARTHLAELDARSRRAEEHERRVEGARAMVAAARLEAKEHQTATTGAPSPLDVDAALEKVRSAEALRDEAEEKFRHAVVAHRDLAQRARDATLRLRQHDQATARADELERTIAAVAETVPTEADFEGARTDIAKAEEGLRVAAAYEGWKAQASATEASHRHAESVAKHAGELTAIVDHLRIDAPRELIAKAKGIPGLGLDGDDLTLDGKSIDAVSGREQMIFAVEVARRANETTKILVVDGLERLDPDALPAFLDAATRDGFQLLATRVDRGEMKINAIEPDEKDEAAE